MHFPLLHCMKWGTNERHCAGNDGGVGPCETEEHLSMLDFVPVARTSEERVLKLKASRDGL